MKLQSHLHKLEMSLPCPHCNFVIVNKGEWFVFSRAIKCPKCSERLCLNYSDKVSLYRRHATLV